MLAAAWSLIAGSRLGRAVAMAVAALVAVLAYGSSARRKGRQDAENEALRDSAERQKEGRDAVSDLRDADRDGLVDQLHKNDDNW